MLNDDVFLKAIYVSAIISFQHCNISYIQGKFFVAFCKAYNLLFTEIQGKSPNKEIFTVICTVYLPLFVKSFTWVIKAEQIV